MPYDPRAIANFILDEGERMNLAITNMAINKIIYFAHGWYLADRNSPLVDGKFEAWEHGPVLPIIYHQFKSHKDEPIKSRALKIDIKTGKDVRASYNFSDEDEAFIQKMVMFYAPKSGLVLRHMSHEQGAPWDMIRSGTDSLGMVISDELIRSFFQSKLRTRKQADVH
jgi:uncharacterized phage-associated protein